MSTITYNPEVELRFLEATASGINYTGFKGPTTLAGNVLYTLPVADGTAGQVLKTNGSGVLAWINTAGAGDALVASPLSQFAATTSAQMRSVISDETGTGALFFAGGNFGAATGASLTLAGALVAGDTQVGNLRAADCILEDIDAQTIALTGASTFGSAASTINAAGEYILGSVISLEADGAASFATGAAYFTAAGHLSCTEAAAGTLIVGAGTTVSKILSATGAIDFASMLTGAEDTKTVTVTGVSTAGTPSVQLGWSTSLEAGIVVEQAWVSGADTVSIRVRNASAGTINPALLTVRATVTSF